MFRPKTERPVGAIAALVTLGAMLAGCSDLYLDRRDAIAFGAGDDVAANQMAQMYDPWPRQSGNVNFTTNGQRMQSAVARYRTGNGTAPADPMALQGGTMQIPSLVPTSGSQNNSSSGSNSQPTTTPTSSAGGTATQ